MYALIDPNYGEPKVVLSTIANTPSEVAVKTLDCRDVDLYGGGSEFPYPHGTQNDMKRLEKHGYKILPITIGT